VSTRKLILLALACGMAILVAGSVQLLRIRHSSSTTLSVGDSTELSTLTVKVVSARVSTDRVLAVVHLDVASSASAPLTDGLTGWSILTGGLKKPVEAVPAPAMDAYPPCGQLRLEPGTGTDCVLAFPMVPKRAGTTLVTYRFVGEQATWALGI